VSFASPDTPVRAEESENCAMPCIDQFARRLGEIITLRQIAHREDNVAVSVVVKISGIFVDPESDADLMEPTFERRVEERCAKIHSG
jgi:hypothetical protein